VLANHRGHLTHTFRPTNPAAFDIKSIMLNGLRDKQFDGTENMSLHEHLSRFAKTCEFCVPPATEVLWSYHTTPHSTTKEAPFTMVVITSQKKISMKTLPLRVPPSAYSTPNVVYIRDNPSLHRTHIIVIN